MRRGTWSAVVVFLFAAIAVRSAARADGAPVDLFRWGNASSPKLDNVRPTDLGTFKHDGQDWVEGKSGGVSLFSSDAGRPNTWRLPKGTPVPAQLDVYDDGAESRNHWLIRPAVNMPMAEFQSLLRAFAARFTKVR